MTADATAIDDLQKTCPSCNGTGIDPSTKPLPQGGGVGRRDVGVSQSACRHRLCKGGKIPTADGLAVLRLCQDYRGVTID